MWVLLGVASLLAAMGFAVKALLSALRRDSRPAVTALKRCGVALVIGLLAFSFSPPPAQAPSGPVPAAISEPEVTAPTEPAAPAEAPATTPEAGQATSHEPASRDATETGSSSTEEAAPGAPADTGEKITVTVHITDTGHKYHTAGCRYLSHSSTAISLDEAKKRGYEACSQCGAPR